MRRTLLITLLASMACAGTQAQDKPDSKTQVETKPAPVTEAGSPAPVRVTVKLALAPQPAAQADEFESALVRVRLSLVRTSRTSFLTEERIPLGELWNGRVELAAVQQRFHSTNLYSVLPAASLAEVSATPGVESTAGRPRTAYGLSLRIHLGRNEN